MTSYILYKSELAWLMRESGYANEVFELSNDVDNSKIATGLAEKGILFESDGRYCTEKTIAFLLYQLSETVNNISVSNNKVSIYECPKMYMIITEDIHNKERCKLTPIQDWEQFAEYLEEHDLKILTERSE